MYFEIGSHGDTIIVPGTLRADVSLLDDARHQHKIALGRRTETPASAGPQEETIARPQPLGANLGILAILDLNAVELNRHPVSKT